MGRGAGGQMDRGREETFLPGAKVCGLSNRADGGGVCDALENSGKLRLILATLNLRNLKDIQVEMLNRLLIP